MQLSYELLLLKQLFLIFLHPFFIILLLIILISISWPVQLVLQLVGDLAPFLLMFIWHFFDQIQVSKLNHRLPVNGSPTLRAFGSIRLRKNNGLRTQFTQIMLRSTDYHWVSSFIIVLIETNRALESNNLSYLIYDVFLPTIFLRIHSD